MLNITNIKVMSDGGGNDNGFTDNTVAIQEINIMLENQDPATAVARNVVKCP